MACWAKPRCANFLWDERAYVNAELMEPPLPLSPSHKIHTLSDTKQTYCLGSQCCRLQEQL